MSQPNPPVPDQPWVSQTESTEAGSTPPTQPLAPYPPQPPYGPQSPYRQPPYGQQPAYPPQPTYPPQPGQPAQPLYPPQPTYGQQPVYPPQPGYPQAYAPGHGETEILLEPGAPAAPRRKRRRAAIAVGAALAVVISGAAVAGAAVWYGWGGTEPEDVLPGSSVVFARADLSPGLGQKLALQNLVKKFPQQPSGTDLVNAAKQSLVTDILRPLDFDADVKPWLGDQIGMALWLPGGRSTQCTLLALASNDDDRAKAALARVPHASYAFAKGYAILAQCEGSLGAQDAVTAAGNESMSAHPAFANALGNLPSGQAVLAWVDGTYFSSVADELGGITGGNLATSALADTNALVGIKATGDGVELRARIHSSTDTGLFSANALSQLDKLPGGTILGAAADLRSAKGLGDSVSRGLTNLPSEFEGFSRAAEDVLGSVISLSLVNPSSPQIKLLIEAADSGSAQNVANALRGSLSPSEASLNVSGNTVSLTSSGYQGGSGSLADDSLYRTAMADPPQNTVLAAYMNVDKFLPQSEIKGEAAANLKPVKALGLSVGADNGSTELLLRVVVQ